MLLDFLPLYTRGFSVLQVWEALSFSFFLGTREEKNC
jgi:hypothetical protein